MGSFALTLEDSHRSENSLHWIDARSMPAVTNNFPADRPETRVDGIIKRSEVIFFAREL
jgi:hypothetical protein